MNDRLHRQQHPPNYTITQKIHSLSCGAVLSWYALLSQAQWQSNPKELYGNIYSTWDCIFSPADVWWLAFKQPRWASSTAQVVSICSIYDMFWVSWCCLCNISLICSWFSSSSGFLHNRGRDARGVDGQYLFSYLPSRGVKAYRSIHCRFQARMSPCAITGGRMNFNEDKVLVIGSS